MPAFKVCLKSSLADDTLVCLQGDSREIRIGTILATEDGRAVRVKGVAVQSSRNPAVDVCVLLECKANDIGNTLTPLPQ